MSVFLCCKNAKFDVVLPNSQPLAPRMAKYALTTTSYCLDSFYQCVSTGEQIGEKINNAVVGTVYEKQFAADNHLEHL